jgi:hypothetical protein
MRRFKRVAVIFLAVDLIVGLGTIALFRPKPPARSETRATPNMSAERLERFLNNQTEASSDPRMSGSSLYTCSPDPNGGWDYICKRRDLLALYDVSKSAITASTIITGATPTIRPSRSTTGHR